jgi:hypothetical protein
MSHVNPSDPTQVSYPWKTAIRTAIQTFLSVALVLSLVAPELQEFIDQFWPGSPVVAWIGTGAIFIAALAGLVTRIMAIEAVNAALTRIGLGATPR